ncbi:MAG: AbrB/MazE/SpoVT family DNA-binding domain-containing protein [Armatimonadetes bacterium]|nr:AbrB/MazE/SpoVT family DNA-binding domain-containing protein [Armatimonadota bacterium]
MATVTFTAKVLRNGVLVIPKEAREELRLHPGDEMDVCLSAPCETQTPAGSNPLLDIIGLGGSGRTDGSVNHDAALYTKTDAPAVR